MASHLLQLNFSVVNYFRFIYHEELIHISKAIYLNNILHYSKRNHFKIQNKVIIMHKTNTHEGVLIRLL